MPGRRIDDEIARVRKELADLEAALTAPPSPPLGSHVMAIALAKIATLQRQLKELEGKRAQGR